MDKCPMCHFDAQQVKIFGRPFDSNGDFCPAKFHEPIEAESSPAKKEWCDICTHPLDKNGICTALQTHPLVQRDMSAGAAQSAEPKSCDGDTHNLRDLFEFYDAQGEIVVRWCVDCGAVAVDRDFDNKTYPGYYVPMKFPNMTFPNQRVKP